MKNLFLKFTFSFFSLFVLNFDLIAAVKQNKDAACIIKMQQLDIILKARKNLSELLSDAFNKCKKCENEHETFKWNSKIRLFQNSIWRFNVLEKDWRREVNQNGNRSEMLYKSILKLEGHIKAEIHKIENITG